MKEIFHLKMLIASREACLALRNRMEFEDERFLLKTPIDRVILAFENSKI